MVGNRLRQQQERRAGTDATRTARPVDSKLLRRSPPQGADEHDQNPFLNALSLDYFINHPKYGSTSGFDADGCTLWEEEGWNASEKDRA